MRPLRIACRIASYRPFEAEAFAHCAELGVRNVEIALPPRDSAPQTKAALRAYALTPTTLHGRCELEREDVVRRVAEQIAVCELLECPILFASVRSGGAPADLLYSRLHAVGETLERAGLVLAIETHPDLAENADAALQTLGRVGHPAIRLNFDTANIAHYNEGGDALAELRRLMPHVASLHLKDSDGRFGRRNFPALGEGTIDFPSIFAELDRAGFDGPCTLEIEGLEIEPRTREQVLGRMAASVRYLRELGRL